MLRTFLTKEEIQGVSDKLTDRQKTYLDLMLKGYSHLEISQMFGINRTVCRKECTQAERIVYKNRSKKQ